ncbi:two-component sensor histidine kinase [Actinomadura sp. NBRC 104412]|uniref:sensor histidine kinase n=1 Tax=Actinomadura sp. NBRC 104412 TaxID=3032203 RepID=UPI0024A19B14|nr:HAMP domain-containing sensor histidine kinase [Actinomadura sp. NBRC 104412]GLZ04922.1 two-component sensor histidine kinase [Actinomadura sp. NBRC 104412]
MEERDQPAADTPRRHEGRLPTLTLRTRVTALAVLAATVVLVGGYIALQALQRRDIIAEVRGELNEDGEVVTRLLMAHRLNRRLLREDLVQVVDARGVIVSASVPMVGYPPVDFMVPPPERTRTEGHSCRVQAPDGPCYLVTAFRVREGPRTWFVYALAPEPGLVPDVTQAVLTALPVPLGVALTGYATWLAAGRALRPVEKITAELDEITATDLQRRVTVPHREDEIARLAASVNATLDRLEGAVARLRGFVSDVSHELRSPLTGLRMELELALSDVTDERSRETLTTLQDITERLQAVLDDLLAIARLESGKHITKERIELQELADRCVLARPRRARFSVENGEPVIVLGGRSELDRLLTNLLDNADRHAASSVTVIVRSETADDGARTAVIAVLDDGPGVAPEDRGRVFERFTRLSDARHRDAGGTGLGLGIARDIATAHGGSLDLTGRLDGRSGARFVLRLPALPPEEGSQD